MLANRWQHREAEKHQREEQRERERPVRTQMGEGSGVCRPRRLYFSGCTPLPL